jgi:hypothetical protein
MYGCEAGDGGYCLAGFAVRPHNFDDVYVVRTDASGDTLWTCITGDAGEEQARQIEPTDDGGFAVFGWTNSYGAGLSSCYFIKLDSLGAIEWTQTYGGTGENHAWGGIPTSDGGYILTGHTDCSGSILEQVYLIKTDADGDTTWTRTYGGSGFDYGYKVQETQDGGYIIIGWTTSYGVGSGDAYLIKTDSEGNLEWQRTYGGESYDKGRSVRQTEDGGYIIAGETASFGAGSYDYYVIRTDAEGHTIWTKTFGGLDDDRAKSVWQTLDGGFIVSGGTFSFGIGPGEAYVWKLDPLGNTIWDLLIGGYFYDTGYCVQQTQDGGFIVAGSTASYGAGDRDFWLVRLDTDPPQIYPEVTVELTYMSGSPVPPGGGNLYFDCFVENQTGDTLNFEGWLETAYEGGTPTTVACRFFQDFQPGWTIDRPNMFFTIPESYAAGNYTFTGKGGLNPDIAWAESGFPFVKEGTDRIAGFQPFIPQGMPDPFDKISKPGSVIMPEITELAHVYPNPFNPAAVISYQLSTVSEVNLAVYDITGRQVAELVNGWRDAGMHEVTFDGSSLASGVYVYQLTAGDYQVQGKMVLMK